MQVQTPRYKRTAQPKPLTSPLRPRDGSSHIEPKRYHSSQSRVRSHETLANVRSLEVSNPTPFQTSHLKPYQNVFGREKAGSQGTRRNRSADESFHTAEVYRSNLCPIHLTRIRQCINVRFVATANEVLNLKVKGGLPLYDVQAAERDHKRLMACDGRGCYQLNVWIQIDMTWIPTLSSLYTGSLSEADRKVERVGFGGGGRTCSI